MSCFKLKKVQKKKTPTFPIILFSIAEANKRKSTRDILQRSRTSSLTVDCFTFLLFFLSIYPRSLFFVHVIGSIEWGRIKGKKDTSV